MKFTTVYSPVTTTFASMTKIELNDFYDEFILNVPYCLDEMIQTVRQTPGFDSWNAYFSAESLDGLGRWLETQVQKRDSLSEKVRDVTADQISADD